MIVRDVMKGEVRSLSPWVALEDALKALSEQNVKYSVVMDGTSIQGIISKDDLNTLSEAELHNLRVKDRMTKTVACVSVDSGLEEAAQKIRQYRLECLPVCQNDTLVGIITSQDLQETFQRKE